MKLDKSIIDKARNVDIISFFERYHGFTFAHQNGGYRCEQHKSLAVKSDRRSWYWHSRSVGGFGALDYLVKVENVPFRQAVETLTGDIPTAPPPTQWIEQTARSKTLILPEKKSIPLRLYDYLCTKRGIDYEIVRSLIQKEMLYEDIRGNVVFVGYDEENKARFASLRGTFGNFRGDCAGSDKSYGFNMPCELSERLYIFESPIDCMSHASLVNLLIGDKDVWKQHNRLSLAGTSETALPFFLNQHKNVKELVFCLDNDTAGREAATELARKHSDLGYAVRLKLPKNKDFNEDLRAYKLQLHADKNVKRKEIDL